MKKQPKQKAPAKVCLTAIITTITIAAAPQTKAQSLIELYEAALENDTQYKAQIASAGADKAQAAKAKSLQLPKIGLQAGIQRSSAEFKIGPAEGNKAYTQKTAAIQLTQDLLNKTNSVTIKQSKTAEQIAELNLEIARQELIIKTAEAYIEIQNAQNDYTYAASLKQSASTQLAKAKESFEAGAATIIDTHEATARRDMAHAQEIAAQNDWQTKKLTLAQIAGIEKTQNLELKKQIQTISPPAPLEKDQSQWAQIAKENNPKIKQAKLATKIAELEIQKAESQNLPKLELQATLGMRQYPDGDPNYYPAPQLSNKAKIATIGMQLTIPIFTGYAITNEIEYALKQKEKTDLEQSHAEQSIETGVKTAHIAIQSGQAQIAALQTAQESTKLASQATQLAKNEGIRVTADILSATAQELQTQKNLNAAKYATWLATLKLKQAAGTLKDQDLKEMSDAINQNN